MFKWQFEDLALGKYHERVTFDQVPGHVPRQLTEQALGSIPPHSRSEPLSDYDPDAGPCPLDLADQQIEQARRLTTSMLLDVIDVTTGTKEPFMAFLPEPRHADTPCAAPSPGCPGLQG